MNEHNGTGRLTEAEFDQTYGERLSQAIAFDPAGRCVVNSALTSTRYVWWDWKAGQYVSETH